MGANTSTSPTLEATLKEGREERYALSLPPFRQGKDSAANSREVSKNTETAPAQGQQEPQIITSTSELKKFKEERDKQGHPWPHVQHLPETTNQKGEVVLERDSWIVGDLGIVGDSGILNVPYKAENKKPLYAQSHISAAVKLSNSSYAVEISYSGPDRKNSTTFVVSTETSPFKITRFLSLPIQQAMQLQNQLVASLGGIKEIRQSLIPLPVEKEAVLKAALPRRDSKGVITGPLDAATNRPVEQLANKKLSDAPLAYYYMADNSVVVRAAVVEGKRTTSLFLRYNSDAKVENVYSESEFEAYAKGVGERQLAQKRTSRELEFNGTPIDRDKAPLPPTSDFFTTRTNQNTFNSYFSIEIGSDNGIEFPKSDYNSVTIEPQALKFANNEHVIKATAIRTDGTTETYWLRFAADGSYRDYQKKN